MLNSNLGTKFSQLCKILNAKNELVNVLARNVAPRLRIFLERKIRLARLFWSITDWQLQILGHKFLCSSWNSQEVIYSTEFVKNIAHFMVFITTDYAIFMRQKNLLTRKKIQLPPFEQSPIYFISYFIWRLSPSYVRHRFLKYTFIAIFFRSSQD